MAAAARSGSGSTVDPLDSYNPAGAVPDAEVSAAGASAGVDVSEVPMSADVPSYPVDSYDPGRRAVAEQPGAVNPIEVAAEAGVLAAVLSSPQVFDDLADQLNADHFGVPTHRAVWAAIVSCDASGRAFDVVTVADELRRSGELARVGGVDGVRALLGGTPGLESVAAYVDIIRDRALRRRMVASARTIGALALDPARDARDALDAAEATVFALGGDTAEHSVAPMPAVVVAVQREMAAARGAKIVGVPTGLSRFDELTGGLRPGQLMILAARPGMGKSVLAMQIARHISEVGDVVVPLLSYEMTQSEIGFRLLSAATEIDLRELMQGRVPPGKDLIMAREAEKMAQLRLLLDDRPPQTISGVRSSLRRLARRGPLGAVVVDYLQLMNGEGRRRDENRQQEVSDISRGLKNIADELGIPIIACAQLSRSLEARSSRRPILSDLRESGSLEQDASIVAFVYRDSVYDPSADESHAELIIGKNRNGPQETIPLDWHGRTVRFTNSNRQVSVGGAAPVGPPTGRLQPGAAGAGGGFGGGGFGGGGFGGGGGRVTGGTPF